jgi:nicotinate-nucleotide--dimethylbenzimidazole phosphoribosyltransferase
VPSLTAPSGDYTAPSDAFDAACRGLQPIDSAARAATAAHLDRLTKPPGSLGRLEPAAVQLAGIAATSPPPVPHPAAVVVFAGDHGVLVEGVSPWPVEVTAQMVANFCAGGAAINVLARHVGAEVVVVDVGVAGDLEPAPGLFQAKVARGTANLAVGPAMSLGDCRRALDIGAGVAAELVARGARCLITGDMGIANTTASAALIAAYTGCPAAEVTGRGTGIGDAVLAAKVAIVEAAVARTASTVGNDPVSVLASLGGLEIAALAGFITGAAAARVPVIIDGVIAVAALLAAGTIAPAVLAYSVAGHRSVEPGAAVALAVLGLEPLLDLDLRLGEGTGACLALPVLQAAAKIVQEMATFDSAGVNHK